MYRSALFHLLVTSLHSAAQGRVHTLFSSFPHSPFPYSFPGFLRGEKWTPYFILQKLASLFSLPSLFGTYLSTPYDLLILAVLCFSLPFPKLSVERKAKQHYIQTYKTFLCKATPPFFRPVKWTLKKIYLLQFIHVWGVISLFVLFSTSPTISSGLARLVAFPSPQSCAGGRMVRAFPVYIFYPCDCFCINKRSVSPLYIQPLLNN